MVGVAKLVDVGAESVGRTLRLARVEGLPDTVSEGEADRSAVAEPEPRGVAVGAVGVGTSELLAAEEKLLEPEGDGEEDGTAEAELEARTVAEGADSEGRGDLLTLGEGLSDAVADTERDCAAEAVWVGHVVAVTVPHPDTETEGEGRKEMVGVAVRHSEGVLLPVAVAFPGVPLLEVQAVGEKVGAPPEGEGLPLAEGVALMEAERPDEGVDPTLVEGLTEPALGLPESVPLAQGVPVASAAVPDALAEPVSCGEGEARAEALCMELLEGVLLAEPQPVPLVLPLDAADREGAKDWVAAAVAEGSGAEGLAVVVPRSLPLAAPALTEGEKELLREKEGLVEGAGEAVSGALGDSEPLV